MQRGQVLPEITETMSGEMSGGPARGQSESEWTQRAGSICCHHPATAAAASELDLQSGLSTDQLKYLQTLERNGFGKEVQMAQETEKRNFLCGRKKNPPDYNESLIFYVIHTGVGEIQCIPRGCGKILKRYSKMRKRLELRKGPQKPQKRESSSLKVQYLLEKPWEGLPEDPPLACQKNLGP